MVVRYLVSSLFIFVFASNINAQNLLINPGFETNNSQGDIAYWHPRDTTIAGKETEYVYSGFQCAKFTNNSGVNAVSYYSANYDVDGINPDFSTVESDAVYDFYIKYKTDSTFSGEGIYIQMCFYKGDEPIGMYQTVPYTSCDWTTLQLEGIARQGADNVQVTIYYSGQGNAWVDEALLVRREQLCINRSFEIDSVNPEDIPDYWHPRGGSYLQYHHVENSLLNTYLGNNAALFNSSVTNIDCYLYGPYDVTGAISQYIPVCPGDSYKISGFVRADTSFFGSGIKLNMIFWNNGTFISRLASPYIASTVWTKVTKEGIVPANANFISYSVEYNGQGKAWADEICLEQKNLAKNSSFETDTASPIDIPDYWHSRGGSYAQYHHVETLLAYEGSKCAQFNNTSGSDISAYFYGRSEMDSGAMQYLDVVPGETYNLSAWGKVDAAFVGTGLSVSLLFFNGDGKTNTFVNRVYSAWNTSTSWDKMSVSAVVPAGANKMAYSMEYRGRNMAWVDRVGLYKTSPWYYSEASEHSLESLSFTPPAKKTYIQVSDKFISYHNYFESNYMAAGNPLGTWGIGYGAQSNNHPLVRCSANATLAYLHAYSKFTDPALLALFENRAKAALDWLLTQQNLDTSSAQYGAFPWWYSTTPTYSGGGEMYEGGLAGLALIKGYNFFLSLDSVAANNYLISSNRLCDYFLTIDGSVNVNFNAFATMALTANYTVTGNEDYFNKAMYFIDKIISFQLNSGMWADAHNQYIWYHGIITRSLVRLMSVLPDSNPKKEVIRQVLYKALNHIRRSQSYAADPTLGLLVRHPLTGESDYCGSFSMNATVEAYALLGITSLSDSLDTFSATAILQGYEAIHGHYFAALGIFLDFYY
jgi:hypothetical protein